MSCWTCRDLIVGHLKVDVSCWTWGNLVVGRLIDVRLRGGRLVCRRLGSHPYFGPCWEPHRCSEGELGS